MYTYKGKVLRVVDGDTYDILLELGLDIKVKCRLRLMLADTPETWRPSSLIEKELGNLATNQVKTLIEGKEVTVKTYKNDKYGRYLCEIITDDGTILSDYIKLNNLLK